MFAHQDPLWIQKMTRVQPNPHRLLHLNAALEARTSQRQSRSARRQSLLLGPVRSQLSRFFFRLAERLAV